MAINEKTPCGACFTPTLTGCQPAEIRITYILAILTREVKCFLGFLKASVSGNKRTDTSKRVGPHSFAYLGVPVLHREGGSTQERKIIAAAHLEWALISVQY